MAWQPEIPWTINIPPQIRLHDETMRVDISPYPPDSVRQSPTAPRQSVSRSVLLPVVTCLAAISDTVRMGEDGVRDPETPAALEITATFNK
jgi:hypothetical protein